MKLQAFAVNIQKFLRIFFFIENLPWLLLKYSLISQENISGEGLIDLQSYLVK